MELKNGNLYFISDDFFQAVHDPYLKINYPSTKRPHYFSVKDTNTGLYWMVPLSTKVDKYKAIIEKRQQKNRSTPSIKIVKIQGEDRVLLFSDMFPVDKKYVESQYFRNGQPVTVHEKDKKKLNNNARKVIHMFRSGIKFLKTQPDIERIERIMTAERKRDKNKIR